jgi:ribonuclease-3
MGIGKELFALMDGIGYKFNDISLLENALTHISYTNEMRQRGYRAEKNETLEFLGDAVLELVVSEELYLRFKSLGEGTLTKMRQATVCESALAEAASRVSLGDYLNVGSGEELIGLRDKPKILADALEAVIGAVYLDCKAVGSDSYKEVVLELLRDKLKRAESLGSTDYKTLLLQFVEKNSDSLLTWEYEEEGPEHNKLFKAIAYINNNKVGEGCGRTKRSAETAAAKVALKLFGIS